MRQLIGTHRLAGMFVSLTLVACGDLGGVRTGPGGGEDIDPPASPDAGGGDVVEDARVSLGLEVLYRFDEGTGAVVFDQSSGTPLNLVIPDPGAVEWMPEGGLNVVSPTTIASTSSPAELGAACQSTNAITIEAWVRPAAVNQAGPARVFTFALDPNNANFTLGQDNGLLRARLRTTETEATGEPATVSDIDAFTGQLVHLAYTRNGLDDAAEVWINGQIAGTETVAGTFDNWDMAYQLAVANDPQGDRPWRGELHLIAVYCRDLSAAEIFQNYEAGY